jgi:hypothetical protein
VSLRNVNVRLLVVGRQEFVPDRVSMTRIRNCAINTDVYEHTHIWVCTEIHTIVRAFVCARVCVRVCVGLCVCICVCVCVCVCVSALRVRIFGSFKLEDALPDLQENHWGFHVDPLEPNRVWWMSRPQGTHTGPLNFPYGPPKSKSLPSLPGCYSES